MRLWHKEGWACTKCVMELMKDAVSFTAGLYLLLGKLSMLWSRYVCGSVCLCSFFCVKVSESELSKCHYRTAICACCFPLWLPVFNPQFDKQLKSFTQHDDWTTAKIALYPVFLLCIYLINLSLFLIVFSQLITLLESVPSFIGRNLKWTVLTKDLNTKEN